MLRRFADAQREKLLSQGKKKGRKTENSVFLPFDDFPLFYKGFWREREGAFFQKGSLAKFFSSSL